MSRIAIPDVAAAGTTAKVYAEIKQSAGEVPSTLAVIGARGPKALKGMLHADPVLAGGSLNKQDQETTKPNFGCISPTSAAPSSGRMLVRTWQQAVEARRARHELMQLDDHLLQDVGLTRTDVRYGDFETLRRHRRAGGIR
jgi:uncharacterized protein YjiS (DUF1127 family)